MSRSAPVMGRTEPRLATPQAGVDFTRADQVAAMAEACGIGLFPWQRWWLRWALALDPSGRFALRTVCTLIARQQGKTTVAALVILTGMVHGWLRLTIIMCQDRRLALEVMDRVADLLAESPHASMLTAHRRSNGTEEVRLDNGCRVIIVAPTPRAARGYSADLILVDELREHRTEDAWAAVEKTRRARPDSLLIAISNAGDDRSVVLNRLRDHGRSCVDDPSRDLSFGWAEWSAAMEADRDDPDGWAQANPTLNVPLADGEPLLTTDTLLRELASDPPATFEREVLCRWADTSSTWLPEGAWAACAGSPDVKTSQPFILVVDIDPSRLHGVALAAQQARDGKVHVEVVQAWDAPTLGAMASWAGDFLAAHKRAVIAGDDRTVRDLLDAMHKRGHRVLHVSAADYGHACRALFDAITTTQVVHGHDPLIDAHVGQASRFDHGETWELVRRHSSGPITATVAVAIGVWATLVKARQRPRVA